VTNQTIARDLLAAFCLLQGLATVAIDLNRTHATNPDWPGHARFHLVWQTAAFAWLALLEVPLVLVGGPLLEERFYLASILACVPIFGFFAAFIARRIYKGTLSDPNGMPPLKIKVRGSTLCIDLNLVAEIGGILTLAAIVALYRHPGVPH
jgi:uncharacterized membrane-anchored protein YitT (DUF2179 family)